MAKIRFALTAISLLILLLVSAGPVGGDDEPPPRAPRGPGGNVSLIISYVDDPDGLDLDDLGEIGASVKYVYDIIPAIALSLPANKIDEVIEELEGNTKVERVESDLLLHANLGPNDPQYPNMWGLNNTGQTGGTVDADIDAPEAWDIGTGSSDPVVAIVDTGIDINHPDLAANIWTNPGGIPNDGKDNDGNGFIDDINGWNFYDKAAWVFFSADEDNHATHVAGTIAADGNNGVGVTGVNWVSQMMVLKFLGPGGTGTTSDAIAAIEYAKNNGASIVNASTQSTRFW